LRDKEPQRIAQYGVWFDKYARKIDELPIVNVDDQEGLHQQQQARTQVKVQEKAAGTSAARAIVKDLEAATAQVRRDMAQKYQIDF
jgi:hypothetical protein